MTLEAGKEMDKKCVLDWLNKVYISPSVSYSQYTDDEIRTFAHDALVLLKEQETGHWISLENCSNSGVYCSECHTKVFDNYPFKKKFSYFCPHCGTRMEGEIERR